MVMFFENALRILFPLNSFIKRKLYCNKTIYKTEMIFYQYFIFRNVDFEISLRMLLGCLLSRVLKSDRAKANVSVKFSLLYKILSNLNRVSLNRAGRGDKLRPHEA